MDRQRRQSSPKTSDSSVEETEQTPTQVSLAKIFSAPVPELEPEVTNLKIQISAPSYLKSLADNDLPPFKKPEREPRPLLLVAKDPLFSEEEMILMVATHEVDPDNGLKKFIRICLVEKLIIHNFDLFEREFLVNLLLETVDYGAQHDFTAFQLSVLCTIYVTTHMYFKWYYWTPPVATWKYFKELLIRHTIEDSPDGQEVFEPEESYDILTHFHTMYIMNLPLVHISTFGAHRLKLNWPFTIKK